MTSLLARVQALQSGQQPPVEVPPSSATQSVRSYETLGKPNERTTEPEPLMRVSTMNEALATARTMPRMQRLMGTLLLKNTLSIWGGDNGVGKTIYGFTVAEHLARGWPVMDMENECGPQKVLVCDFELILAGLRKRYSDEETGIEYQFSPNLFRAEFNPDFTSYGRNYDDLLFESIRALIKKTGAEVVLIDNLTALKSQSNSDGDIALDLMNRLNRLKKELDITIVVLTHVTKLPAGKPIEKNDIAGSKHIQNLCDSIIGIGKSAQGENKIYLKELKNRYEEEAYGGGNVIVCQKKKVGPFLTVEFVQYDAEGPHLTSDEGQANTTTEQAQAVEMRKKGQSIGQIAEALKRSKSTIQAWTKSVRSYENTSKSNERTNEDD